MSPIDYTPSHIEIIDSIELARRWKVPVSWVKEYTRERATDPIPHLKLGRYVRFEWGSEALEEWFARRRREYERGNKKVINIRREGRRKNGGNGNGNDEVA